MTNFFTPEQTENLFETTAAYSAASKVLRSLAFERACARLSSIVLCRYPDLNYIFERLPHIYINASNDIRFQYHTAYHGAPYDEILAMGDATSTPYIHLPDLQFDEIISVPFIDSTMGEFKISLTIIHYARIPDDDIDLLTALGKRTIETVTETRIQC